jgi:serine/threonine protein phosphatase PrpC
MARLHSFTLSERGLSVTNTDAICSEQIGGFQVFAVAAGRSGNPAGREAGEMAIASLREAVASFPHDAAGALAKTVDEADMRIGALATRDRKHTGMGTELCACVVDDAMDCTILDTGGGGVYYCSPGSGILMPYEIPFSGKKAVPLKRKMISHTLGEPRVMRGNEISFVNLMDSFIILSSAGFHDYVRPEEIQRVVRQNGEDVDVSCEELKDVALKAGSTGTITLIILHGHST